jgi:hypothetical protein
LTAAATDSSGESSGSSLSACFTAAGFAAFADFPVAPRAALGFTLPLLALTAFIEAAFFGAG